MKRKISHQRNVNQSDFTKRTASRKPGMMDAFTTTETGAAGKLLDTTPTKYSHTGSLAFKKWMAKPCFQGVIKNVFAIHE